MNKLFILLVAAIGSLTFTATAQNTNTAIGIFEMRTGTTLVKAVGLVGSLKGGSDTINVRMKETTDVSAGQRIYGLAIELAGNTSTQSRILMDDSEIDSLLSGLDYLIKIKYDITTLPSFEASFTTKAGLRLMAHSIRREGTIVDSLEFNDHPTISLSSVQMTQLYDLIAQAQKSLNGLKNPA